MNWKRQLPNFFTALRILLVPVILLCLMQDQPWSGFAAAGIFIFASLTDYFDGAVARHFQVESVLGKFLDPVADKVLVTSTLVMMIPSGRLDVVMVIILLSRDIIIGGIRSVAASENLIIGAGVAGKWKTAIQMVAIPAVIIKTPVFGLPIYQIGYWTLWVSVALSLISGAEYVIRYFKETKSFSDPTP